MIRPRRIVTGINEEGRSEIFLDDVMEPSIDLGGNYFIELWNSSSEPLEPSKKNYPDLEPVVLSPGKGEVKIRYFQIPPRNENRDIVAIHKINCRIFRMTLCFMQH